MLSYCVTRFSLYRVSRCISDDSAEHAIACTCVSFFLYLLFRHAISPLVSANCLLEVLPIVMTTICLRPSWCGEMIEQGRTADSNLRLLLSRKRKTDGGIGDFLVEWKFRSITGYMSRAVGTLIRCSATESENII